MAMQQGNAGFGKKHGAQLAAANAEHAGKPVDTGDRRLPAGIRSGVAKLASVYTKEQTEDDRKVPKGEVFFRASAVVMTPEVHNNEKVAGLVTQQVIPLCAIPAKGLRKAKSFSDNWYEFQNLFKLLGVPAPTGPQYALTGDPARDAVVGQQVEAYYMAAMNALTARINANPPNPIYISFSTRGWTPKATPQDPKPEERVEEEWHGLAQAPTNGQFDPAAGVVAGPPSAAPPGAPVQQPFNEFAPPPQVQAAAPPAAPPPAPAAPAAAPAPAAAVDPADAVASLVEVALNDPEGATDEGAEAGLKLQEMALARGWTQEQVTAAPDWGAVGDMVLTGPPIIAATSAQPGTVSIVPAPGIGSKHKFAKRTKDGAKLKDGKGVEFPPNEVEVVTVDTAARVCTVKSCKDGKMVVDIRTKEPIQVKFEWLE